VRVSAFAKGIIMKVLCLKCKTLTNHKVEGEFRDGSEKGDEFIWGATFSIIRCCGCDSISFRQTSWTENDIDPATNKVEASETLYPSRTGGKTAIFDEITNPEIPTLVLTIYQEVVRALNCGTPILAAVGLRAVIEAICKERKAKGRSLKEKIDDLATKGDLAKRQAEILHSHRFLGNTAAHEVTAPPAGDLLAAFDIAETMLKTIYVLPKLHSQITTGKAVIRLPDPPECESATPSNRTGSA
jgi:hypothetical protein